jgi:hypothetical protein
LEVFWSLEACPQRGLWDPGLFLSFSLPSHKMRRRLGSASFQAPNH